MTGGYGDEDTGLFVRVQTLFTTIDAAVAQQSRIAPGFVEPEHSYSSDETTVLEHWRWIGDIAQEVTLEKFVSVFTSLGREWTRSRWPGTRGGTVAARLRGVDAGAHGGLGRALEDGGDTHKWRP